MRPSTMLTCGRSARPAGDDAADDARWPACRCRAWCSEISTTISFDTSGVPSAPQRHLRLALDERGLRRGRRTLWISVSGAPCGSRPRCRSSPVVDQRLLQARIEHQHRRKHEHHQRHAAGGERGGEIARPQVAERCRRAESVMRRALSRSCRRPSTIVIPARASAAPARRGRRPRSAQATCSSTVSCETLNTGKSAPVGRRSPLADRERQQRCRCRRRQRRSSATRRRSAPRQKPGAEAQRLERRVFGGALARASSPWCWPSPP